VEGRCVAALVSCSGLPLLSAHSHSMCKCLSRLSQISPNIVPLPFFFGSTLRRHGGNAGGKRWAGDRDAEHDHPDAGGLGT
jgi:hypothetical protein